MVVAVSRGLRTAARPATRVSAKVKARSCKAAASPAHQNQRNAASATAPTTRKHQARADDPGDEPVHEPERRRREQRPEEREARREGVGPTTSEPQDEDRQRRDTVEQQRGEEDPGHERAAEQHLERPVGELRLAREARALRHEDQRAGQHQDEEGAILAPAACEVRRARRRRRVVGPHDLARDRHQRRRRPSQPSSWRTSVVGDRSGRRSRRSPRPGRRGSAGPAHRRAPTPRERR